MAEAEPTLEDVLASAARLQEIVPDAVLVGGSAAAYHAGHRISFDHDHVVADLAERFETILAHLEALDDWSTARLSPRKLILGSLGDIESGIRQLRRQRPLEIEIAHVAGRDLRIPTRAETLRIKAWLALSRNQTRDYVDIAALAESMTIEDAADILADIDAYYSDLYEGEGRVATQLVRQLADPHPRDHEATKELHHYKQLDAKWHDWATVAETTRQIALGILELESSER